VVVVGLGDGAKAEVTGDRAGVTDWRQSRVYTRATVPDSPQPPRPRARERGRARRRLRYLRQVRELQLRDAGGFVFELYRFGEQRDALVRAKLDALIATDKEIRSLEALLGVAGRVQEIRQPGVGGTCANCGAFHASEATFCAHCGVELKTAAEAAPAPPVVFADRAQPAGEAEAPGVDPPGEEFPAEEEVAEAEKPALPEADGEVTFVSQASDEPSAAEAPVPNGAVPAADEEQPVVKWPDSEPATGANGEVPAPSEVDPDAGEVAAVGPGRPRARRGRARRRRGNER
jgi:hypothetical protein